MKKILFVDDEPQILKSITRVFMDTDYELITADSGEKALKILEDCPVDLVVSDMRMPYMDGYEFLSKVKELYPDTMRMILSGYSEESIVCDAVQKNIAKMYFFKPWDNKKFLKNIEQIFETEDILKEKNLMTIINNVGNLPTIKSNYERIISLVESDVDITTISYEIEKDPAIAAKILHVANSAFFAANTGSIKQAVSFLGLQNTKNLVTTTSIIEAFSDSCEVNIQINNIWGRAFLCNKLIINLYEKHLNKKLDDSSLTAGLLMNIGSVFFLDYYKEKYINILIDANGSKTDLYSIEKDVFKITHCEAGGYLLKWWEFPYPIVEAALYHHNPMDDRIINKELLCACHIVTKYVTEMFDGSWAGHFYEEAFDFLEISKQDFELGFSSLK